MKIIAHIHTDFPDKFGIPRQSGLVKELKGQIIFEPEYNNPEAVRGLERFSHIWLLWEFSENIGRNWSPTVRPPRLGGNERVGVFATRSPFRPNPIGLSAVRLLGIERHNQWGVVLRVAGADLLDGTPIYDIKPYLPHIDSHPQAAGGFAAEVKEYRLQVECPQHILAELPQEKQEALLEVLANDPRPAYHDEDKRVYGMKFAGYEVKFRVENGIVYVTSIVREGNG